MNADALMSRYWLERERRERGEHTGLKAISLALTGIMSECCRAKVTPNRHGELLCTECFGLCEGQPWLSAHAEAQRGDGYQTMHLAETRIIDRDRVLRLRVEEADRYLRFHCLAASSSPALGTNPPSRWTYLLHAYGWFLVYGPTLAAQRGLACFPKLGGWSETSIRTAVAEAREVLARRTNGPSATRRYLTLIDRV